MSLGSRIESIGVYLPERIVTTSSIADRLRISGSLKLELITGISERRVCSETEDSLVLALEAAKDCLRHSSIIAENVEMIIFCAISKYVDGLKHVYEPAISFMIKEKLGMERAICFDISNACAGMLTGMHIGTDFIERGEVSNCLVVSGEYITSLSQNAVSNIKSHTSPEIASLTVGDAGGALLLCKTHSEEEKIVVSKFVTLGKYCDLCIGYQSNKQPGGIMETEMKQIHNASIRHAPSIIEEALSEAGLKLGQIDCLIPHQTSKLAIKAGRDHIGAYFGEMARKIIINLDKVGNTASTSHMLALYKLLKEKRLHKGERVMLLSFASGLVIGVMIFTIQNLTDQYGIDHS
ncbi:MAG: 3-oxoacyl-[acyl-carrier-protein] synthase III C-terminal domain-containing protein [Bacteroidota bacterium]